MTHHLHKTCSYIVENRGPWVTGARDAMFGLLCVSFKKCRWPWLFYIWPLCLQSVCH